MQVDPTSLARAVGPVGAVSMAALALAALVIWTSHRGLTGTLESLAGEAAAARAADQAWRAEARAHWEVQARQHDVLIGIALADCVNQADTESEIALCRGSFSYRGQ